MEIKTERLVSKDCFESLCVGDILLIKWDKTTRDNLNSKVRNPMFTTIREIKKNSNEIILEEPNNLYFNYLMYLFPDQNGISRARIVERVHVYK